jgi:hypothetical protein
MLTYAAGGDYAGVVPVGAWELECLKKCIFLLTCGAYEALSYCCMRPEATSVCEVGVR